MIRRARKQAGVPVLKLSPERLVPVVVVLGRHEYDREGFKSAVIEMFRGKSEKSVFRGMAVPTLRALGLLIGFEQEMRLTGDGALIFEVSRSDDPPKNRAVQRMLLGVEGERELNVLWRDGEVETSEFLRAVSRSERSPGVDSGDLVGHVRRWLGYLEFFGLVRRSRQTLTRIAPVDYVVHGLVRDPKAFGGMLVRAYVGLAPKGVGEPVLSIDELHRALAIQRWKRKKDVLLRRDFDECLRNALRTGAVDVHLHRSMGAEQGLFKVDETYYQAISIRETEHGR